MLLAWCEGDPLIEERVFCSALSCTSMASSAKNCAKVIPKASQMHSSVVMEGMVFLLRILAMVEARQVSCQKVQRFSAWHSTDHFCPSVFRFYICVKAHAMHVLDEFQ